MNQCTNKWTRENIIAKIQDISKEHKITKSNIWNRDYGLPSIHPIQRFFGSLDNLAKEANIRFYKQSRKEYLQNNPAVLEKILLNSSILQKGFKKNKHWRKNLSKSFKGRVPWNKGQHYTPEQLEIHKKAHIIYTNEYLFKQVQNYVKRYKIIHKKDLIILYKKGKFCTSNEIYYRFGSMENFAKQAGIYFTPAEPIFMNLYNRKKGINEDRILDEIEKIYNIKLSRHETVFSKDGKRFYYPDAIDHQNRIIYEVDEAYHKSKKVEDSLREKDILNVLSNYSFVHINEKEFINRQ